MTYNRAEIMKAAWVIVRRFAGNRETNAQRLSRALKSVWWNAKQEVRIAATLAAEGAKRAVARPAAVVRAAILTLECKDSLRGADWAELSALHDELRRAA